jgi:undecaprenyl-diphosphatase
VLLRAAPFVLGLLLASAVLRLGGFDTPLFLALNGALGRLAPDVVWSMLSEVGLGSSAAVIVLALWRGRDELSRSTVAALIWCYPIGGLLSSGLKRLFDTPRPPALLAPEQFRLIGARLTQHSLPSGHAITAFTVATLLVLVWVGGRRWVSPTRAWAVRLTLFALAVLVALSRVAVAAHWPSDICAGAGLGVLCAVLAQAVSRDGRLVGWLAGAPTHALIGALLLALGVATWFGSSDYPLARSFDIAIVLLAAVAGVWWLVEAWRLWRGVSA